MKKEMTNAEIYGLAKALSSAFNMDERYLPARVNFFISKNKNTISQLADIIEDSRLDIIKHYGTITPDGNVIIPEEQIQKANAELVDLLNLSHEIEISMLPLSALNDLEFTPAQMQALLFMIEED